MPRLVLVTIIGAFCPWAGLSLQTQAPRLQFCPRAGIPPQTQESRLQFYQGLNRCRIFPLLSAPDSLFSIWKDLKKSEMIPESPEWRWGEWIWLPGQSGLYRNSPQGFNITVISVFEQIWDPDILITLLPLLVLVNYYIWVLGRVYINLHPYEMIFVMTNDIRGWMGPTFFPTFVLRLRKNDGKTSTRKTDPTGERTRAR